MPRPMPPAATAAALHEEDEDGPTMVVTGYPGYPKGAVDDEATQVQQQHPLATTLGLDEVGVPDPAAAGPIASPPLQQALPQTSPVPGGVMAEVAFAQREAAMDAALQAALGTPEDIEAREVKRTEQIEMALVGMLGAGLFFGTLAAYLSSASIAEGSPARGASYGVLTVVCSLSLFAGGVAPLQRKTQYKQVLLAVGSLLLVFVLVRLLVIAVS